jgi:hypothetical protein
MRQRVGLAFVFAVAVSAVSAACGEDPPPPPPPPPTILSIQVVDASTDSPVSGAEVLLEQLGETMTTDASGTILLNPIAAGRYTYRAQAAGYILFPRPHRDVPAVQVVAEQQTAVKIALEPRPNAPANGGTLEGTLTKGGAPVQGALVVASSLRPFAAYSDKDGKYRILGMDPNLYSVTAFLQGHSSSTVNSVDIGAGGMATADLTLEEIAGASASGMLIGGTGTSSVVIAHRESRFAVPGLSTAASFGGEWSISGIPPGEFEIFAGTELDGISLDAEWELMELMERAPVLEISAGTSSVTIDLRFKEAIAPVSPAGTSTVVAPPTFVFPEVAGANRYVFEVKNVLDQTIYGGFDNFKNPINPVLAPISSWRYDGPALTRGALYSWRVYALKNVTTGALFEIISASEELGGEFRVAR